MTAPAFAVLALAACSPALNWREVRPEGAELLAMFPCKPASAARSVPLAGRPVQMRLASCSADGVVYALGYASLDDVTRVAPALDQLSRAASDNIAGSGLASVAFTVPGMTPNPLAQRWRLAGRRGTDGKVVNEEMAVFTKGMTVFQATLVGPALDKEAVDTFFAGLRFKT